MRTLPEECCDINYIDTPLQVQCLLEPAVYLPWWAPGKVLAASWQKGDIRLGFRFHKLAEGSTIRRVI